MKSITTAPKVYFEPPSAAPSIYQMTKSIIQRLGETKYPPPNPYSITSTVAIKHLITIISNGCSQCGGKHSIELLGSDGHCLMISLRCENGHLYEWKGSEELEDGTYRINREMVCNWEVTGGETEQYFEMCELMKWGNVGRTEVKNWLVDVSEVILEQANKSMEEAIQQENQHTEQQIQQQLFEAEMREQQELEEEIKEQQEREMREQQYEEELMELLEKEELRRQLVEGLRKQHQDEGFQLLQTLHQHQLFEEMQIAQFQHLQSQQFKQFQKQLTTFNTLQQSMEKLISQLPQPPTTPIQQTTPQSTSNIPLGHFARVHRLVDFSIGLSLQIIHDFLLLDGDTKYVKKAYYKKDLQEVLKTIGQKITGNKDDLITRVNQYLIRLLQTNNDPTASVVPP